MTQKEDTAPDEHVSGSAAEAVLIALERLHAVQCLEIQRCVLMIEQLQRTHHRPPGLEPPAEEHAADVQPDFVLAPYRSAA